MSLDSVQVYQCARHPRELTAVRCSKCEKPICTRCMVQTPVGARCRECAALRKLPQHEVDLLLLGRAALAGLAASTVVWALISGIPFLRYFLGILVGVAVGEVMSRLARRRSNLLLEATAVLVIVAGYVAVEIWRFGGNAVGFGSALALSPSFLIASLIPVAIAGFVAVIKLR